MFSVSFCTLIDWSLRRYWNAIYSSPRLSHFQQHLYEALSINNISSPPISVGEKCTRPLYRRQLNSSFISLLPENKLNWPNVSLLDYHYSCKPLSLHSLATLAMRFKILGQGFMTYFLDSQKCFIEIVVSLSWFLLWWESPEFCHKFVSILLVFL